MKKYQCSIVILLRIFQTLPWLHWYVQTHEQMWILHGAARAKIILLKKLCINIVRRWEAHGVHPAQAHVWHRSTRLSASDFFLFFSPYVSLFSASWKTKKTSLEKMWDNFSHICVYACTYKINLWRYIQIKNTFSV